MTRTCHVSCYLEALGRVGIQWTLIIWMRMKFSMPCPADTILPVLMFTGSRRWHNPEDCNYKGSHLVYFCNKVGSYQFSSKFFPSTVVAAISRKAKAFNSRFLVKRKVASQETCIRYLDSTAHEIRDTFQHTNVSS